MTNKLSLTDSEACFLLDAGELGDDPPKEFRILKGGSNRARKNGVDFELVFDAKSRKALAENIRSKRPLPFDVGHAQLSGVAGPEGHEAVGWFQPVIRGSSLFATEVEFNEEMAAKIKDRKFRFFSPGFDSMEELPSKKDDDRFRVRPLGILNLALTNLPALRDIKPLVADATGDVPKNYVVDSCEMAPCDVDYLRAQAARLGPLQKRLGELSAARIVRQASDREDEIERLHAAGKLPKSLHNWARTKSVAELSAWATSHEKGSSK